MSYLNVRYTVARFSQNSSAKNRKQSNLKQCNGTHKTLCRTNSWYKLSVSTISNSSFNIGTISWSNLAFYDVKTFWRKCMNPNFTCIIEGWFRCHYTVCCSNTKCLHNLGRQKGRLPNKRAILTAMKVPQHTALRDQLNTYFSQTRRQKLAYTID